MIGQSACGRLHVITDETVQSRYSHEQLAELAARGGADVVQFRDKRERAFTVRVATARAMAGRLQGTPTRLVVNDSIEVAIAAGAHGVHLGPRDASPTLARGRLGPHALVGATVHDLERLQQIDLELVSYVGAGPVFGTRSKADPPPALGLAGLERIVRACPCPVLAIGQLTPERVVDVLQAGAHGVAVLSDVVCSRDPAERVARFAEVLGATVASEAR